MKIALILLATIGIGFVLWGFLGLYASSVPSDDGASVAEFASSGIREIAFGLCLLVVYWLLRRRQTAQGDAK